MPFCGKIYSQEESKYPHRLFTWLLAITSLELALFEWFGRRSTSVEEVTSFLEYNTVWDLF